MLNWKHFLSPTDKVQLQQPASRQAKRPAWAIYASVCVYGCVGVCVCVGVCRVALARRPHSCTLINLEMISGGKYHMILSVIENSSYLPSLDLTGKKACGSRG